MPRPPNMRLEESEPRTRLMGMRSMVLLLIATAAIVFAGTASAMTLPTRVKMTVASKSCQFSKIVLASKMQSTLARRCSGTAVGRVRLPRQLEKPLTVRRGKSWVIKLQDLT
jgi:hypothetical protein